MAMLRDRPPVRVHARAAAGPPCRVGYHAAWDTIAWAGSALVGHRSVAIRAHCLLPLPYSARLASPQRALGAEHCVGYRMDFVYSSCTLSVYPFCAVSVGLVFRAHWFVGSFRSFGFPLMSWAALVDSRSKWRTTARSRRRSRSSCSSSPCKSDAINSLPAVRPRHASLTVNSLAVPVSARGGGRVDGWKHGPGAA